MRGWRRAGWLKGSALGLAAFLSAQILGGVPVFAQSVARETDSAGEEATCKIEQQENGSFLAMRDGQPLQNGYLVCAEKPDGFQEAVPGSDGSQLLWFGADGVGTAATGIYQSFYYKEGQLQTNRTAMLQSKGVFYRLHTDGSAVPFSGIYSGIYYENGVPLQGEKPKWIIHENRLYRISETGESAVFCKDTSREGTYRKMVDNMVYRISYQTGKASVYTGVYLGYYYVDGKKDVSKQVRYWIQDGYLYRIEKTGAAAKYLPYPQKTGYYRKKVQDILYRVSYQTGAVQKYTGMDQGYFYQDGVIAKSPASYFLVYQKKLYTISKNGAAKVRIQDASRTGTYHKRIDGNCYRVSYQTGAASKYTGIYDGVYYDKGVPVEDDALQSAVAFVEAHAVGTTRSQKLYSCYQYLYHNYGYIAASGKPTAKTISTYAQQLFANGVGNCFRFGAAFAYIAAALGYPAQVAVGSCSGGGGWRVPHGWAVVDGLVCDPDYSLSVGGGGYRILDTYHPWLIAANRTYTFTVKDGKVVWK